MNVIWLLLLFTGVNYQCLLLHNSKKKVKYLSITKNKNGIDRNNSSCVFRLKIDFVIPQIQNAETNQLSEILYTLTGTNASGSFLYKHFTIRHLQAAIFQNLQEFETFNFPNFIVALFRYRKFNFVATYRFLYPLKPFIFSEFLLTIVNKRIAMITMEHSQKIPQNVYSNFHLSSVN